MRGENKIAFIKELGELLKKYSREDVESMEYKYDDGEICEIHFSSSEVPMKVNINHDSVTSAMLDIAKALL